MLARQAIDPPLSDVSRRTPYIIYGEIVGFGGSAFILASNLMSISSIARQNPLTFTFWIYLLTIGFWLIGVVACGWRIRRFVRAYVLPNGPDPRPIFLFAMTIGACAVAFVLSTGGFVGEIWGHQHFGGVLEQIFRGSMAGLALGSVLLLLLSSLHIARITRSLADALKRAS